MYLKSIQIEGFKSFADKIKIRFLPGLSAIIGPNGSGKSNISDGIRWVLGEQSYKLLRAHVRSDVIFAGTTTREPLNFASVILSLDNSKGLLSIDTDHVEIERKQLRTGESRYYMNGKRCKHRDIKELFMDTGLGIDAYSMIGQGQIEQILSTSLF